MVSYSHNNSRKLFPKPEPQLLFPKLEDMALGFWAAPVGWN